MTIFEALMVAINFSALIVSVFVVVISLHQKKK
ncbi:putative holin-like toxin [Peribacillus cavernae]